MAFLPSLGVLRAPRGLRKWGRVRLLSSKRAASSCRPTVPAVGMNRRAWQCHGQAWTPCGNVMALSWALRRALPTLGLSYALTPLFSSSCSNFPLFPHPSALPCQFSPHESEVGGALEAGNWGSSLLETCLCANRQRAPPSTHTPSRLSKTMIEFFPCSA